MSEGMVAHVAGSGAWFSIEALDARRALRWSVADRCDLEVPAE